MSGKPNSQSHTCPLRSRRTTGSRSHATSAVSCRSPQLSKQKHSEIDAHAICWRMPWQKNIALLCLLCGTPVTCPDFSWNACQCLRFFRTACHCSRNAVVKLRVMWSSCEIACHAPFFTQEGRPIENRYQSELHLVEKREAISPTQTQGRSRSTWNIRQPTILNKGENLSPTTQKKPPELKESRLTERVIKPEIQKIWQAKRDHMKVSGVGSRKFHTILLKNRK